MVPPFATAEESTALTAAAAPCWLGAQPTATHAFHEVRDLAGRALARAGRAPRLLQLRMLQEAEAAGPALRAPTDADWFGRLASAGRRFAEGPGAQERARLVSRASGLPEGRVRKAHATLASDLGRMRDVLAAQAPDGDTDVLRTGRAGARAWMAVPRGRHLAVRVPGNFPTVNINWLMALASRRPVLVCASLEDPFTPAGLVEALYACGVPQGAVSLCHGDAELFWSRGDQVLMSGRPLPQALWPRVQAYHHGRSKAVLASGTWPPDLWRRLAQLAVQGCGRLCTNVSAVLTDREPDRVAREIACRLAEYPVLPLDDPRAFVPAFPDHAVARELSGRLAAAVARGARDVSAEVTGLPALVETAGGLFLRPTVLRMDADDALFGVELPFPFVTVAQADVRVMARRCRGSLIVSFVGDDAALLERLVREPAIDKVFHGSAFDRGYEPTDPHEGYLFDFLFQRKAVAPHAI